MYSKIAKLADKDKNIKYWDYREGTVNSTNVSAWNNQVKEISSTKNRGYSFRVLYKGGWGFSYSDIPDIKRLVKNSVNAAKKTSQYIKKTKSVASWEKTVKNKKSVFKINPLDVSLKEKKDLVVKASKITHKRVKNKQINYVDITKDSVFINCEESHIKQRLTYCYCSANVTASGKTLEKSRKSIGGLKGFEVVSGLNSTVKYAKERAIELSNAEVPKGGMFPVVCDGVLTDVFIHEALGHAAEADIVIYDNSCLKELVGKRIAPEHVSVIDDATIKKEWGSFFYDDEGIPAQKTAIIKQGVLNSFLHTRETASILSTKPTGNSRAQNTASFPQARMSNTYLEKGKYKFEELIESIKKGFFLKGSIGGQVDPTKGNFHFSAAEGYIIKNGQLNKPVRGVSLAGNSLKTLHDIKMISNKYEYGFPGHCGKGGQFVPVMGNCPSIKISKARVGGK